MSKSEIFDRYAELAQKKGLIKKAEGAEQTEKSLDNPRWDSLSIEQISKLYDLKPETPADMKYKKNIIEIAHPEPVVLAPSYDKLNGLVENENERQNINLRIVNKTPDGNLVNKKYAESQLMLSLVKTANDLDNNDLDELRALADVCLEQLSQKKSFKKTAVPVLVIVGIAAAVLGAVYLQQHLAGKNQGFQMEYNNVMEKITNFINSNSITMGVGHTYRPEFIKMLSELQTRLTEVHTLVEGVMPILDGMSTPRTGKELLELSQKPETLSALEQIKKFRAQIANLYPYITKIINNLKNPAYQTSQIADKGVITNVLEQIPGLMGGNTSLLTNKFDDAAQALGKFMESLTEIVKKVQNSDSVEQQAKRELAQFSSEFEQKTTEQKAPEAGAQAPENKGETEKAPWDDIEKELGGGVFGR